MSDVDNTNSIRLTGIEIESFISRKTQSHLRLKSGNTFAMAGMLNDSTRATYARVPLLGDIPIFGSLFRYVQHRRDETELMIFVTPRLVRPLPPDRSPPPGVTEDNNPNDFEVLDGHGSPCHSKRPSPLVPPAPSASPAEQTMQHPLPVAAPTVLLVGVDALRRTDSRVLGW